MVKVVAKSRRRATVYWWAISTDEKAWTVQPLPTKKAKTSYANLTPGTTYYFRFQTFNASRTSTEPDRLVHGEVILPEEAACIQAASCLFRAHLASSARMAMTIGLPSNVDPETLGSAPG